MAADNFSEDLDHDAHRRNVLRAALATGGAALAATALVNDATAQQRGAGPTNAEADPATSWRLMFEIYLRFPPGRLQDWYKFWGDYNVPLLEKNGQWLWGALTGLTGQENTITHFWAYRDLTHYQQILGGGGGGRGRGGGGGQTRRDPPVREAAPASVPIEEVLYTAVMTPTSYHPSRMPEPTSRRSIIVTHRLFPSGAMGGSPEHARLASEYVPIAEKNGAQLIGAFSSFFGFTPAYTLQLWRYPSVEQYIASRQAIAADATGGRLLAEMQKLLPREVTTLHEPTPYSRIR